jgi:hypothetical protein
MVPARTRRRRSPTIKDLPEAVTKELAAADTAADKTGE